MKNHKQEKIELSYYDHLEGPVEEVISKLRSVVPEGATDPRIEFHWDYDDLSIYLYYWRPLTKAELDKAKAKRKVERERKKREIEAREAAEYAEYERLKRKFESDSNKNETS